MIAHVDHGWRQESRDEALLLQEEASKLGCPFFTTRLELKEKSEDAARKARYAFFQKIAPPEAALLLAHQADDLAETVLKRIFEGAQLTNLGAMREVSSSYGLVVWRPFLKVSREEIVQFLEERSLIALHDSSNDDLHYLRVRMRKEIFPFLNSHFGKEIKNNLLILSERAHEFKKYLDKRVEDLPVQKGPWGTLADLKGLEPLEQKYIIQKLVTVNRDQLETLFDWVQAGVKSKELEIGRLKISVDEGRMWIYPS